MELSAIKLFSLQQICLNTVMYKTQTEIAAKNKKISTFIYLIHGGLVIPCMKKIYTGFSQLQSNKKILYAKLLLYRNFQHYQFQSFTFVFPEILPYEFLTKKPYPDSDLIIWLSSSTCYHLILNFRQITNNSFGDQKEINNIWEQHGILSKQLCPVTYNQN